MAQKYKLISFLMAIFVPVLTGAATLTIIPENGSFQVGSKIPVKFVVSSNNIPINAISGTVSYPTSMFSVDSVSKARSILDFWISDPNSLEAPGVFKFEGVDIESFKGKNGNVVTVTFKALKTGVGTITITSGQVLASDDLGTDVTSGLGKATYIIEEGEKIKQIPVETTKEPEPPPTKLALTPPEITLVKENGIQIIYGASSYPQSEVLLTFASSDKSKIYIVSTTDNNGKFVIPVPYTLKRGVYIASAIVIQKNTAHSHNSNELIVRVGNIFSDISYEIWILIILLILAILYLLIRIYQHLKRDKRIGYLIEKEAKEAEDTVEKSLKNLENEAGTATVEQLKRDIDEAEKAITKEIKDIEKENKKLEQ